MYVGTRVTLPRHTSRDRKREKRKTGKRKHTHCRSVVVGCRITKTEQKKKNRAQNRYNNAAGKHCNGLYCNVMCDIGYDDSIHADDVHDGCTSTERAKGGSNERRESSE